MVVPSIEAGGGGERRGLRTGYTTGACATAGAKAAAIALVTQLKQEEVEIDLPNGETVRFVVARCEVEPVRAICSVVKDGGDDPDVTHGAEVIAEVSWDAPGAISIEGGKGVGVVTKPGLGLPVGAAAINPVPLRMIDTAVRESLGETLAERGVRVVISVPGGELLARKTLNQRLGIVGGISILGTTGIVIPFSTSAYTATIDRGLRVAAASGCNGVVLTTGRRTERFAQKIFELPEEAFVQVGDHIGFALESCARMAMRKAILCLMVGKLSKIAAGELQTHAGHSEMDVAFLSKVAAQCGADPDIVGEIASANTGRHFLEIGREKGLIRVFERLCELAAANCYVHVEGKLAIECLLVDYEGALMGRARVGG